ncbi:MAG: DUF3566 domain-containing protein [Propionibacteriales bacterium]|nr:DUF3566 domain-containing protein [Propionibacteriales bacterium]
MTDFGDDQPLAPRRSLSKASTPSRTRSQPVTPTSYAGAAQQAPAAPVAERSLPVPQTPDSTQSIGPEGPSLTTPGDEGRPAERTDRTASTASRTRTVRRAKLRLVRVDPWSVTKSSFLLSIAFGVMCVVAVFLIFSVMSAAGLWTHINDTIQGVLNQKTDEAFDIEDYVGMDRVMGITMLIAVIDVVIITALATLSAFIYNMAASLLGGVEVTLAEDVK